MNFKTLETVFRTMLTGHDNVSYDFARVGAALAILVYLGLAIANWREFHPTSFGAGFGVMVSGVGVLLGLKAKTEPGP